MVFSRVQARLFDEPQLASLCLDTIDKSTADAIGAEGFTDIDIGESPTGRALRSLQGCPAHGRRTGWGYTRAFPPNAQVCPFKVLACFIFVRYA